jgi:RNA polymerase sigma-70 factor (ECF subfamily)
MDVSRADIFRPAVRLDERAFEAVFHELYPKIYTVLFRLTGDRFDADDLATETFWRLWERPPAQNENIAGWLYRVATRLGYNTLRSKGRREQHEVEEDVDPDQNGAEVKAPAQTDPAREVEQRMERQRVREVLKKMPIRDVQVLLLRYSGLSYKEIAAAVDVAYGSVGTLLSRAETKFEALYRQGESNAHQG